MDDQMRFIQSVTKNRPDVLRTFLEHGWDPDTIVDQMTQATGLIYAATQGCSDVCRTLLDFGANVNAIKNLEATALHEASKKGWLEVCRHLVERGADINAKRLHGITPLIEACENSISVCRFLIEHGADVNAMDRYGFTPLHVAISVNKQEIANELLSFGADPNLAKATTPTALHLAIQCRNHDPKDRILLLLERGADPSFIPVGAKGGYLTPFQEAVATGKKGLVQLIFECSNVDPEHMAVSGSSMMDVAGENGGMRQLLTSLRTEYAVRRSMQAVASAPFSGRQKSSGLSPL